MKKILVLFFLVNQVALAQYKMNTKDEELYNANYRLAIMGLEYSYEKIPAMPQVFARRFELNDSNMWTNYNAGPPLEYLKLVTPTRIVSPENMLKITPVPAIKQITFHYDYCNDNGATVLIENAKSLQVAKLFFAAKTKSYVLDISNWATGNYFYAVIQNNAQIDKGRFEKIK